MNPKTGVVESGFKVANSIRDFLAKQGVLRKGYTRERFKLYFRPQAQSTPNQILRDLQRGGFECVAAMSRYACVCVCECTRLPWDGHANDVQILICSLYTRQSVVRAWFHCNMKYIVLNQIFFSFCSGE